MTRARSFRQWFTTMWQTIAILLTMTLVWTAGVNTVVGRLYYGAPFVNGRLVSVEEELPWRLLEGVHLLIGCLLVLPIAALIRWQCRWWAPVVGILVVGSPIAIYCGYRMAWQMWYVGDGIPAEMVLASPIGFTVGLASGLVLDHWLNRRAVRRSEQRAVDILCPSCAFDLRGTIAGGAQRCPECGASFVLARIDALATPAGPDRLTGVVAVRQPPPDTGSVGEAQQDRTTDHRA
jgi:hypothetical protein